MNIKKTISRLIVEKSSRILFFTIIIIHLAGFVYKVFDGNLYMDDSIEYLYMAENISNEGVFYCGDISKPINFDFYTKRPPLYSLFVSAVHFFWKNDLMVVFLQNLISLFNILLLVLLASKLGKSSIKVLLLLVLISPVQVIYANMLMSEIILQTWILLMVSSFLSFIKTNRPLYILWVSVFLILAMLTKPVMYPFALIVFLAGVFYAYKEKSRRVVYYAILPMLFLLGFNFWNKQRTGVFHFSSIQTINLVQYNTYFFIQNQSGEEKAQEFLTSTYLEANQIEDYGQKQDYLKGAALGEIKKNLPAYLWFHAKGAARWFVDPGRFDYYNFFGVEAEKSSGYLYQLNREGSGRAMRSFFSQPFWMIFLLMATFATRLVLLCGFIYWIILGKQTLVGKLAIAIPILFVAAATGPLGASRFMLPLLPLIILAASIAISNFWEDKSANI